MSGNNDDNNNNDNNENTNNSDASGNQENDDDSVNDNNGNTRNNDHEHDGHGNNNDNGTNKIKGACEEHRHEVFDCTSRKHMESCNNTLKAIATHAGKSNEHGKQADPLKCLVEKEKEPAKEWKEPDNIKSKDINNPIKMHKWQEKHE